MFFAGDMAGMAEPVGNEDFGATYGAISTRTFFLVPASRESSLYLVLFEMRQRYSKSLLPGIDRAGFIYEGSSWLP